MTLLAAICFFLSGVAGLVFEVLWTKMLTLVFGSTTLAVSTTVASFMGGLSLGSVLAVRMAARWRNPLMVYAGLELAIGVYALAVPSILALMPSVQATIWPMLTPQPVAYSAVRFAVTFAVLVLPTTAMGATLPVLASYFVRSAEESGIKVGYLYALNTAGALGGTMLAGFVLIPSLGVRATNMTAAALDVVVAILMFIAGRRAPRFDTRLTTHDQRPTTNDARPAIGGSPSALSAQHSALDAPHSALDAPHSALATPHSALLLVALAAGFASMALQVMWTRALSVVIGSSTYSFTIILSAFLAGISIGSAAASRALPRRRDIVGDLAVVLTAIGASAFLCNLYVDRLPFVLQKLLALHTLTMPRLHAFNFVVSWMVVFVPTFFMGAFFPLMVHLYTDRTATLARDVGRLYAANTFGNILGSALAGFVLIPVLGIRRGLLAVTVTYLLLAAAVAVKYRTGERLKRRLLQAGAAAGLAILALVWSPSWDVARWASGMFRIYLARSVYARQPFRTPKILYHRDGMVTTVTVEGRESGTSLKVNGKVDASTGTDMHTQILSGMWPMLLHGNAKDVAMVGLGSGVTAGAILKFPLERFRVIELESAVAEAARFFDEVNNRPWSDPRLEMIFDDGRNHLAATKDTFDIIVSEPSNPWVSGASNLFTREFWQIAAARLRPGGIFGQWLQLYELSSDNIRSLMKTYHSVFPHVLVFHARTGSNDTIMIGSNRPIVLRWDRLEEMMARRGIREEFARAEAFSPHDLLALLLLDESSIPEMVKGARANTDDNSLIEFSAPRDLLAYAMQDADVPPPRTVEGRLVEALEPMIQGRPEGGEAGALWLAGLADALIRKGRYDEARRTTDRSLAIAPTEKARIAAAVIDLLEGEERIFPFDTTGRAAVGEKWGYFVDLLSTENYTAAQGLISPPETGEMAIERLPGAYISFPKPALTGKRDLDFLRGYLYLLMGSPYEALYLFEAVAREPGAIKEHPMLDYFMGRARIRNAEMVKAADAMRRFARSEAAELERAAGAAPVPVATP
jgi:spermidine synthase